MSQWSIPSVRDNAGSIEYLWWCRKCLLTRYPEYPLTGAHEQEMLYGLLSCHEWPTPSLCMLYACQLRSRQRKQAVPPRRFRCVLQTLSAFQRFVQWRYERAAKHYIYEKLSAKVPTYLLHGISCSFQGSPYSWCVCANPKRLLQLHLQFIEVDVWHVVDSLEHVLGRKESLAENNTVTRHLLLVQLLRVS